MRKRQNEKETKIFRSLKKFDDGHLGVVAVLVDGRLPKEKKLVYEATASFHDCELSLKIVETSDSKLTNSQRETAIK